MDAYVFIRDADPGALETLGGEEYAKVPFVAPITGPYLGIAVVRVDDLPELESLILNDFRRAGVRETETAIALRPEPAQIKWRRSKAVEAFIRIWVQPGKAVEVLDAASNLSGAEGAAAVVAGDFDVLVNLSGDSFQEVARTLVEELHQLPGTVRTASSFAVGHPERA
jgi:DNA-binding Lrp family transcriptional regulator